MVWQDQEQEQECQAYSAGTAFSWSWALGFSPINNRALPWIWPKEKPIKIDGSHFRAKTRPSPQAHRALGIGALALARGTQNSKKHFPVSKIKFNSFRDGNSFICLSPLLPLFIFACPRPRSRCQRRCPYQQAVRSTVGYIVRTVYPTITKHTPIRYSKTAAGTYL